MHNGGRSYRACLGCWPLPLLGSISQPLGHLMMHNEVVWNHSHFACLHLRRLGSTNQPLQHDHRLMQLWWGCYPLHLEHWPLPLSQWAVPSGEHGQLLLHGGCWTNESQVYSLKLAWFIYCRNLKIATLHKKQKNQGQLYIANYDLISLNSGFR